MCFITSKMLFIQTKLFVYDGFFEKDTCIITIHGC